MNNEIQLAADILKNARHAIALTGAGISVPSGIPDFRSPGSGLWDQDDPMEVASFDGFMANPNAFYNWIRPLARTLADARPNPAHHALAELEQRERLRGVITQNIDNLHQRAGSQRVWELHGHTRQATCVRCYRSYDGQALFEKFVADGEVPRCAGCGGVVKPNLILFGEMLPMRVMHEAEVEARTCDAMLVAGSSLEVAPACDLPMRVCERGAPLIIVNLGATHLDPFAAIVLHADVAEVLPKIVRAMDA